MRQRASAVVRSLRFRLMLWNGGAVLVTGLAILLAVRAGVRHTLIYDMDQVLREDIREILLSFEGKGHDGWSDLCAELNRKAIGHSFHDWFAEFHDSAGARTWASVGAPGLPQLTGEQRRQGALSLGGYRLSYNRLPPEFKPATSLVVGCSERFVPRDMARIDRLIGIVALVILCAAPLAGHLLTSRTIKPLANMIRTTARLRPGELDQRLPIRQTGDELDSLARTINGLLDRIADYLVQEHDFLANAAHELRTPLAAIQSSVEVALGSDRSSDEYRELLDLVIEQCAALQSLVNQLLLLAETDAHRLQTNFEPVPLDDVLARAVAMFEGVAEVNGIRLRSASVVPVVVSGRRYHLRQVLNNLLDNAIKFTAQKYNLAPRLDGGEPAAATDEPEVSIELVRDDERGIARLTVRDNGVGIPAADLPNVFDRFYRADRSRGRGGLASGTGLGLSICQAIVAAHHGTIQVRSELGCGTTVTLTLPLSIANDCAVDPCQATRPLSRLLLVNGAPAQDSAGSA